MEELCHGEKVIVNFMPYKPKRPCSHSGCPELTNGRFCEEHAKQEAARYEKYQRDPATRKRYGKTWRKIRTAFLSANPLCEICKSDDKLIPAELVHHIVPLADGGTNEWSNLQALCSNCHSSLHLTERNKYGN